MLLSGLTEQETISVLQDAAGIINDIEETAGPTVATGVLICSMQKMITSREDGLLRVIELAASVARALEGEPMGRDALN